MPARTYVVSFMDRGKRESVEVWAESAYEAAVLGIKAFQNVRNIKGPGRYTVLEIEVKETRQFKLRVGEVLDWLYRQPRSPKQTIQKKKLRAVMADDGH